MPTRPEDAPDRLRLRACQEVLRWVREDLLDARWPGNKPPESGSDLLIAAIFFRSTRTYEAIVVHLGSNFFGEQAAMLNRSLFEDMIDAQWVSLNPELAVERIQAHQRWTLAKRAEVVRAFPDFFDGFEPKIAPLDAGEERELNSVFLSRGRGSWTGEGPLGKRVESVLSRWQTADERRRIVWAHEWMHRLSNETLHSGSAALDLLVADPEGGPVRMRTGASPELLADALLFAVSTYLETVGLLIDSFEICSQEEMTAALRTPTVRLFQQANATRD